MPIKDPVKRKEYRRECQRPWMLDKLHERKELSVCRVSGCGDPICEGSTQYCGKHLELNKINSQNYRNRKKQVREAQA